MRINREVLLGKLEAIQPGIATKEVVVQSSCFVFQDGKIFTFNDEIACTVEYECGIEGAVAAQPLLELLQKMQETEVKLDMEEGQIIVRGKRRRSGITKQSEVVLPIDLVEKPETWTELHDEFSEALAFVQGCATKNEDKFCLACVHIHPNFVEACNNVQMARYSLKTGLEKPMLARRESIKHIIGLGMTEFSETESWLHFRNEAGLVLSIRRYTDKYPSLKSILENTGTPITLPGGLAEAAEKASIFSSQNDDNQIIVDLKPGRFVLRGQGSSGWYEEMRDVKYKGEAISFMIEPNILVGLSERQHDCEITERLLIINSGKYKYISCLGKVV